MSSSWFLPHWVVPVAVGTALAALAASLFASVVVVTLSVSTMKPGPRARTTRPAPAAHPPALLPSNRHGPAVFVA